MPLQIDLEGQLDLTLQGMLDQCIAVLGVRGTGKSNTVGVLIEELLAQGVPIGFIDPEGEMWGLKERYPLLVVGNQKSKHADLVVDPAQAGRLAQVSVERGISIILDLLEYKKAEADAFLTAFLTALWDATTHVRRPYVLAIEEAHEFLPQGGRSSAVKEELTRLALRGRKRGISLILSSQRAAKVEKDVLTQATLYFLHQVIHPLDLGVYKDLVPREGKEVENLVRGLERGQALVVASRKVQAVTVRKRYTFHPSSTPTLAMEAPPVLTAVDLDVLADLRTLLSGPLEEDLTASERERLHARMQQLEQQVVELKQALAQPREGAERRVDNHPAVVHTNTSTLLEPLAQAMAPAAPALLLPPPVFPTPDALTAGEQQRLALFRRRLLQLPKPQQRLLRLLALHEPKLLSPAEIAAWLMVAEKTIQGSPPTALLQLGLVARTKMAHGTYHYRSQLRTVLHKQFPRLETEPLAEQLLHALPSG